MVKNHKDFNAEAQCYRGEGPVIGSECLCPLKLICWNTNLKDDTTGSWGLEEGGASTSEGTSALIRGPREVPCPFHHVRTQREGAFHEEEGLTQTPNLQAPTSWTSQPLEWWEANFCCLEATQVMVFGYSSLNGQSAKTTHFSEDVYLCCHSVARSCPTLQPHGLQHARLPCPSLCPAVCSVSCPLSWWCYLAI